MTTVSLTVDETFVLLALIDVPIAEHAPIATVLADRDAANTSPDDLRSRGLLVDEEGRTRPNVAVATALATLAQPEESLELHFGSPGGERTVIVSRVKDHRVALETHDRQVILRIPVSREEIVRDLRMGLAAEVDDSLEFEMTISPAGQFLLGVLARHDDTQRLSLAEVSIQADRDMLVRDLVVGTAVLDPGAIDRIHRNPTAVGETLSELIAAGAVVEDNRLYTVASQLGSLLRAEATGTLIATRTLRDGSPPESTTTIRFADALLQVRHVSRQGLPLVSLATVNATQASNTIAALLFTDDELRSLQTLG